MKRRRFLSGLLGLALAPALVEKIRVEPKLLRSRKVYTGDFRISRDVLAKLRAEEGAFTRYADAMLADIRSHHFTDTLTRYGG